MRQNLDQKMFHKFSEDATAIPTNNISGGKIAGSVEAGDDPPVRKKRNQYSTNDVAMSMTPHISIEQENNTDYFCSDQSEPEMIPS